MNEIEPLFMLDLRIYGTTNAVVSAIIDQLTAGLIVFSDVLAMIYDGNIKVNDTAVVRFIGPQDHLREIYNRYASGGGDCEIKTLSV